MSRQRRGGGNAYSERAGGELEREYGFGVIRQLFEPVLGAASAAERTERLDGAAGQAARLLGLPGASPAPATAGGRCPIRRSRSCTACTGCARSWPALARSALVVDDAQWADAASLRYLAFLLPRLEELPVTALAAVRAGEEGSAAELLMTLSADPAAEMAEPQPLRSDAVGRFLATALGKQPDAGLVAGCHRATGGVPFLVEQLTRRLHDDGVVSPERIEMAGPGVARWVLARLERLGAPAMRLARAVAILEVAQLGQAAELAGLDRAEVAIAQGSLARAGILGRGRPLSFAHPIVRRTVYDAMGSAERSAGHQHAARLLADAGAPR
jgi:hypothetical protein